MELMKEAKVRRLSEEEEEVSLDLDWVEERDRVFWLAACTGFEQSGRGALVVDLFHQPPDGNLAFGYHRQAVFEAKEDEISRQLVQLIGQYDPVREFVIALAKADRVNCYKLRAGKELREATASIEDAEPRAGRSPDRIDNQ